MHGERRPSPYVGRRPFRGADQYRFFGRADEARRVADLWLTERLTILTSVAGAGRTSLLNAGIIPLVESSDIDILPVGRGYRGTAFPLAALAEQNPHTLALLSNWSPGDHEVQLAALGVYDFLRKRPAKYDRLGHPVPLLAAIDQIEEILAPRPGSHWEAFAADLVTALKELPHLRLLLSVAEDYRAELTQSLRRLWDGEPATVTLGQLPADAALHAVRSPAAESDRSYAPGVAETLVESLTGADGDIDAALLQVVCAGLWAALPESARAVTARDLTGLVGPVLEEFCADVITAVAVDQVLPVAELAGWLREAFVTGAGAGAPVRVPEGPEPVASMPPEVLRALRARHLLAVGWDGGSRWYELRHQSLTRALLRVSARDPRVLEAAVQPRPVDYLRAAEGAMTAGDLDRAEGHAGEALRMGGQEPDVRVCGEAESLLGNVAYARGNPAAAELRYRAAAGIFEILQDTPAVAGLLAAIGKVLLAQGRPAQAVDYLHSAAGRLPNDVTVQTGLAWALWHAGQRRAAVEVLTSVLAIDGGAPAALRARGEILADMGDAEGALRDLDRIRPSESASTLAAHGLALAMTSGPSAADPKIGAALSRAPDSGPVLLYAARAAALGEQPDVAADLARRAVNARDPAVPAHQRQQALTLLGQAD